MGAVKGHRQIVLNNDEVNKALGVAGREARLAIPAYNGPIDSNVVLVRPMAPGYGGTSKHQARGRVTVPGYGTAPITVKVVRFPNSPKVEEEPMARRRRAVPAYV